LGWTYYISLGELVLSSVAMNWHIRDGWYQVQRATIIMMLGLLTGLFFQFTFLNLSDLMADHAKKHTL